ncbi:MAG: MTH1187 family thiamine-binding protein [Oscillospiraceae bacterium]
MKKHEASLAIQVLPKVEDEKIFAVVDEVIAYLKGTGLPCFVGPFETVLEGGLDQLFGIALECQKICIRAGAPRVSSYIKVTYNPTDGVWGIEDKVAKHRS